MKTKKNIIITEEECKASSSKSKTINLGTRKKPKTLLQGIDNVNTLLDNYIRENGDDGAEWNGSHEWGPTALLPVFAAA